MLRRAGSLGDYADLMRTDSIEVVHVFWESTRSGLVILSADWDPFHAMLPFGFGPNAEALESIEVLPANEAGRYYRYFRQRGRWLFRIQSKRYPQLSSAAKKVYLAGDFNGWEKAIGKSSWELEPSDTERSSYEVSVSTAKLSMRHKNEFKFVTEDGEWLDVPDSAPNRVENTLQANNFLFNPDQSGQHIYRFRLREGYEPKGDEYISWQSRDGEKIRMLPHTQLLLSASSDLPLGVAVEPGKHTTFRLFAPRADAVKLVYGREADGSDALTADLERQNGSVWTLTLNRDLDGWYYSYRLEGLSLEGTSHFHGTFPVLDPYALACLGHRGPGIIVSKERLPKIENPYEAPAWHDLVILEGHVRDFAAHAPIHLGVGERKGFAGLRKWLQTEGSYIQSLGVNAVELQPIQEFDNEHRDDYHWGYMTVNYFSPESSYAQDPEEASQIEEFRDLVSEFHQHDLAVILDVVYNHVGEPNHLLFIDKYYYFHLDEANDLVNWSGCGNDLRCDTPMGRRLIIDSLKHLIEVYDVDGFRFDLAELIGIDVLGEIEWELKQVKPSIILIAEPWSFRGHIQEELRETGYSSWNDGFRDGMAAYVRGEGNQDMIGYFLSGSPGTSRFAAQTINYTESHDDHCWIDRITESTDHDGSSPTWLDQRRSCLMASVLFTSLGVPMLAAGQDFLRSKKGIENTYQRGDLNALDYNEQLMRSGVHDYFRSWIRFRVSPAGAALRFDGTPGDGYLEASFCDGSSAIAMVFNADYSKEAPRLLYGINPHNSYTTIDCPAMGQGKWMQLADAERFSDDGLAHTHIPVNGTMISLPPLSCGLWLEQA